MWLENLLVWPIGLTFFAAFLGVWPVFWLGCLRRAPEASPARRLAPVAAFAFAVQVAMLVGLALFRSLIPWDRVRHDVLGALWCAWPAATVAVQIFFILRVGFPLVGPASSAADSDRAPVIRFLLFILALAGLYFAPIQAYTYANSGPLNCNYIGNMWMPILIWAVGAWLMVLGGRSLAPAARWPSRIYGAAALVWACGIMIVPVC